MNGKTDRQLSQTYKRHKWKKKKIFISFLCEKHFQKKKKETRTQRIRNFMYMQIRLPYKTTGIPISCATGFDSDTERESLDFTFI